MAVVLALFDPLGLHTQPLFHKPFGTNEMASISLGIPQKEDFCMGGIEIKERRIHVSDASNTISPILPSLKNLEDNDIVAKAAVDAVRGFDAKVTQPSYVELVLTIMNHASQP